MIPFDVALSYATSVRFTPPFTTSLSVAELPSKVIFRAEAVMLPSITLSEPFFTLILVPDTKVIVPSWVVIAVFATFNASLNV